MNRGWQAVLWAPVDYALIGLVWLYKIFISPFKPKTCRFLPTCSTYMILCIKEFHAVRGVVLGLRRLGRCTPKNPGGWDPVPLNIKGEIKWTL